MTRSTHNPRRPARRGYTLMELMVVLALVAIAAAIAAPAVGHAFGNLELRLAAGSVTNLLKQARTHAVYQGRVCAVVFGPAGERPRTLYLVREDGRTVQRVTLPAAVSLRVGRGDDWGAEAQPLHFYPNGSSEPAQIDIENQRDRHVQLALDPLTARARVSQIYTGDGAAPAAVTVVREGAR